MWPTRVIVTESSPRDGLQSLGAFVPTADKVSLIRDLSTAGIQSFDAVSFVNPAAVPQMADAAEVVAGASGQGRLLYGLVPNRRGLERALESGVGGIGVLTAASNTFTARNINASVAESMERIRDVFGETPDGIVRRAYISTITHCPYEGRTDPGRVAELTATLLEWGTDEVFLGETLGTGTVGQVAEVLERVLQVAPPERIGVHFHDTYGQAIANLALSLQAGISRLDSSAGGLGGCPYAPGAAGNVATEDVLWLLDGLGIDHGIDLARVAELTDDFCLRNDLPYLAKTGKAVLSSQVSR